MSKLVIPKLPPECDMFVACSAVETRRPAVIKWVKSNACDGEVAPFKEGRENRWLSLKLGLFDSHTIHFHIGIARKELEGEKRDFKSVSEKMSELLEKVSGSDAYTLARSMLKIPQSDIPETGAIAKLLRFNHEMGKIEFSLSGGCLEIKDEFFDRLTVNLSDNQEAAFVELSGGGEIELDHDYLNRLMDLMVAGSDGLIFERLSNVSAHAQAE